MSDVPTPAAPLPERLVRAFVDVADTLVDDYDVVDLLHRLCRYCVDLLGAAETGIMLTDQQGGLQLLGASTERARLLELFEVQTAEGPCIDAYRAGEAVHADDLATMIPTWPSFAPLAIQDGFQSVQAVPLRLRSDIIGALTLLGHQQTGPLSRNNLVIGRALADTATIGILQERAIRRGAVVTEQLQTALHSRIIIEQAKGALAHAGQMPPDQAFEQLRDYSRRHNTRITDLARHIADGTIAPTVILDPPARRP